MIISYINKYRTRSSQFVVFFIKLFAKSYCIGMSIDSTLCSHHSSLHSSLVIESHTNILSVALLSHFTTLPLPIVFSTRVLFTINVFLATIVIHFLHKGPTLSVATAEVFTSTGQPTLLLCETGGSPPPTVTWIKGNIYF